MTHCPRCQASLDGIYTGYPKPDDLETILEEVPGPILAVLAERLRECRKTKATAHLVLHANVHLGEAGEWKFDPDIKVRKTRKAC